MNLRMMANFLRIAEAGSLKAAADMVHTAQPALTRQIVLLEKDIGATLFLRHRHGVTLTEAGAQFREHAERILAEVSRARAAMSNATEKPTGTVSLGLPTALRHGLSSSVIAAYHRAYPDVEMKVHEAFVHVLEQLLQSRQLDVAVLFGGARKLDGFDLTPLATEDVYLVGSPQTNLSLDKTIAIKEIAKLPVILISRRNKLRQDAEQALARHRLKFRTFLEVEGQPLTHDLVANGVGYTISPYCDVQTEIESGQLNGARIRELTITWALAVNRLRAHTPAVRELTAMIRRAAEARIKEGNWRPIATYIALRTVQRQKPRHRRR